MNYSSYDNLRKRMPNAMEEWTQERLQMDRGDI